MSKENFRFPPFCVLGNFRLWASSSRLQFKPVRPHRGHELCGALRRIQPFPSIVGVQDNRRPVVKVGEPKAIWLRRHGASRFRDGVC